jgi:hypothetical protein
VLAMHSYGELRREKAPSTSSPALEMQRRIRLYAQGPCGVGRRAAKAGDVEQETRPVPTAGRALSIGQTTSKNGHRDSPAETWRTCGSPRSKSAEGRGATSLGLPLPGAGPLERPVDPYVGD